MLTKRESRPGKPGAAQQLAKADTDFTRLLGLQRHEPLTREDRDDIDLLIRAAERGFRLSTTCVDCGHPLTALSSIRRHRGPKCHAKAVGE